MTICISAIAEESDNKKIVMATDHMISISSLGQFEKEIKKYRILNHSAVALLSGQTLLFDRCIQNTGSLSDFDLIKNQIHLNMKEIRRDILQKELYDKYKIDEEYVKNILVNPVPNDFVQEILESTNNFSLDTIIMLVGFDSSGNARISEINEKSMIDVQEIDFHTIGSGQIQAMNTLLFEEHHRKCNLKNTIYSVYKAKKNAEVAVGVGTQTEMLILDKDGCKEIEKEDIDLLSELYKKDMSFSKDHTDLNSLKILS